MLSNNEIQAMITAIGTGIGEEFDVAKLRYHRLIVMTDADVDGSHIRTLILTFLYRQMPELIERGHVYIAAAPLYRAKLGSQEFYFEKDIQLEDLLARERIPQVVATDREGNELKLTEAKWHRFVKELPQYEGYSARLRSDFGVPAAELMIHHRLVEHEIDQPADVGKAIGALAPNGYELSLLEPGEDVFRIRLLEIETSTARSIEIPVELLASPIYAHVRKTYARLAEVVGLPPFTVTVGKEQVVAETYETLRTRVLDAAKQGLQLSRFKGLGEMNPDQLWETTMDPEKRLLIRVDVEDAHGADRVFSMLMGDAVEPRRESSSRTPRTSSFSMCSSRDFEAERAGLAEGEGLRGLRCGLGERGEPPCPARRRRARRRPHRAARARAGDALELPRLRDVGHRRPCAAGRARRVEAGPSPCPLCDVDRRQPAGPAAREVRRRRRRDRQALPPAQPRGDLRHSRPDGAAVLAALPARRRAGQLRLGRRRSAGGHALHRGAADPARRGSARARVEHGRLRPELRRVEARAARPAGPLPEPARQRLRGDRRRDGDRRPRTISARRSMRSSR